MSYRMTIRICTAVLLASLTTAAGAASFDCAKASSDIEKMICANPALGAMDEALAEVYARARQQDPAAALALRTEQRTWLRLVRDQCFEEVCLAHAQLRRIVGLEQNRRSGMPKRVYGQFSRTDEACFVDNNAAGRTCEGEVDSTVVVLPEGRDRAGVYALLFFFNGHTCQFEGSAQWRKGQLIASHRELAECRLTLDYADQGISTSATQSCREYCGMRGTLDGIELERR